jgi:hypothetical protein
MPRGSSLHVPLFADTMKTTSSRRHAVIPLRGKPVSCPANDQITSISTEEHGWLEVADHQTTIESMRITQGFWQYIFIIFHHLRI